MGRHTGGWKKEQPSRGHANPCLHGFSPAAGTAPNFGPPILEGRAVLTERTPFAKEGKNEPEREREEGGGWEYAQSGRVHFAPNLHGMAGWM